MKPVHAMGHLHALWHAALEQQEDGDLATWTDPFIAASSHYSGSAPQYVSLLQRHGWLDGKLIHDWIDYAGDYLKAKYHTSYPQRLVDIWAKHGREYGGNVSPPKGDPDKRRLDKTDLKNAAPPEAADLPKTKKRGLHPVIKAAADRILTRRPELLKRMIQWIRIQEGLNYKPEWIADALMRFEKSDYFLEEKWWGYLNGIAGRVWIQMQQLESSRHKDAPIPANLKGLIDGIGE